MEKTKRRPGSTTVVWVRDGAFLKWRREIWKTERGFMKYLRVKIGKS